MSDLIYYHYVMKLLCVPLIGRLVLQKIQVSQSSVSYDYFACYNLQLFYFCKNSTTNRFHKRLYRFVVIEKSFVFQQAVMMGHHDIR